MLDLCGSCAHPSWQPGAAAVTLLAVLMAGAAPASAEPGLRCEKGKATLAIFAGDRLLVRYQFLANPYKPYVDRFVSPGGINVVRDSPADHKHHHGLMFAISVDGLNFWEEHQTPGKQVDRGTSPVTIDREAGLQRASFTQKLDWIDPRNDALYLQEERVLEVYQADDLDASLLSWQAALAVPAGKSSVTLTGHRYFGLGVRFLQSMDDAGHFQNADGKTGVAGTNLVRSAWCAYTARADGKLVTLAMFDHPRNPRHPAKWYTMGERPGEFAYLANTLNLKQEALVLPAGAPLEVRYGVALWDGEVDAGRIDRVYQRWLALPFAGKE